MLWRHPEAEHEGDALSLWDGAATVRLFDAIRFEDTIVLLLERCHPGTALRDAVGEPESDEIIATLLRRLWIEPPAGHPFRSLAAVARQWADELEHHAGSRPHPVDDGLVRAAVQLLQELPASGTSNLLLATDLQASNVLAAEREPWLVIDPKPHVGDPAYDPVQHILNCLGRAAPDPLALVDRMANLTGVDADRLRLWLFVRCVQASVNPGYPWPETAEVAVRTAP